MIWNETKECMSRDEMQALQGARLVKLVDRVYHNVAYYRKRMQAIGLEPGDIRGLEDLTRLPFTTKDDLRDTYPFGMFAVPNSQIVRIHASSGTTGKATVVGYTRRDIDVWSECVARCITMAGLGREDIIQVAYGYGLFTGGLGGHYGADGRYGIAHVHRQHEEADYHDDRLRRYRASVYALLSDAYRGDHRGDGRPGQDQAEGIPERGGALDGEDAGQD